MSRRRRAERVGWCEAAGAPVVSGREVADAVRGVRTEGWAEWGARDGGFLVRDRSLRVGFRGWGAEHRERWEDARARGWVTGHYDRRTGLWSFEDAGVLFGELAAALAHLAHPRCGAWLRALSGKNRPRGE